MNKIYVLKTMSALFLIAILFAPVNSNLWFYFLVTGLVFGALWFEKLE